MFFFFFYEQPKVELPEYGSDDESKQDLNALPGGFLSLDGGMEVVPSYPPTYSGIKIITHFLNDYKNFKWFHFGKKNFLI